MATAPQIQFGSVGIIDDDASDAEVRKYQVEEAGGKPFVFHEGFSSVGDLITRVQQAGVEGVICDHRLKIRHYAPFNGAEAVARLFDLKIPAVLISKYAQIDVEAEIRPYREKIPVLLSKDDVDPDSLFSALSRCKSELAGTVPLSRRPRRTLVRVDEVAKERGIVDVFIPAWNPNQAVRIPLSIIPVKYQHDVKADDRFYAQVNTDAENAEELFFRDFEAAPKVDEKDDIF